MKCLHQVTSSPFRAILVATCLAVFLGVLGFCLLGLFVIVTLDPHEPMDPTASGKDTVVSHCGGRYQILTAGSRDHLILMDKINRVVLHEGIESYEVDRGELTVSGHGKTVIIKDCLPILP